MTTIIDEDINRRDQRPELLKKVFVLLGPYKDPDIF
jgi:hypothetical protein